MAKNDPISKRLNDSLRDYWLQFYRKKKFHLPEELEEATGKSLKEMGLSRTDFVMDESKEVESAIVDKGHLMFFLSN